MFKSAHFTMVKGDNSANFRILCRAAKMLKEQGDVLKTEGILEALDAWEVRPVEFAEVLAGKPVPQEYRAYMGGNLAPTNCPDEYWAGIGTCSLMFRDCKQYLRTSLRMAACNGILPKPVKMAVCHLVYGVVTGLYEEYGDTE